MLAKEISSIKMEEKRKKNGNVPNLRFPGFEGDWLDSKFLNIGEFFKGKGISKDELTDDGAPCILYGELYTKYKDEVITEVQSRTMLNPLGLIKSKKNDIIIPSSGESAIDIATACCVNLDGILLGGDLNVIRPHKDNGNFLSYQLNGKRKKEIAKLAQGSSVVHLYNDGLKKLNIFLPTDIQEQEKIAKVLNLIDNRIQTQIKIIRDLETSLMSLRTNIFNRLFRFKDSGSHFSEWKMLKLGDIGIFFSGGTPLTSKREYYNGSIPFIRSGEINSSTTQQFITGEALKNSSAKMVKAGDILYALYGATSGEVGISKISGAINQAILCIRTDLNPFYILHYLKSQKENIINTFLQGGQGNLSAEIIKAIKVPIPSMSEQFSIGNFLNLLDNKIQSEKKILRIYQDQKKYLMEKMFI